MLGQGASVRCTWLILGEASQKEVALNPEHLDE